MSLFWFLGVWWCFPHSGAAANLPCSIVLLASLWTCTAINMAKCSPSEAGLQEDNTVTGIFCTLSPSHTQEQKRDKSLDEALEQQLSYCTTSDPWDKSKQRCLSVSRKHPQTTHRHTHTIIVIICLPCSTNLRLLSPPRVQPNLNRELIFLSLLISKWSLSLISVSCWFGFKDLDSYLLSISQKNMSMCGQDKLRRDEVQMNASVVVFGQFSKAAEEKPSKSTKHRNF